MTFLFLGHPPGPATLFLAAVLVQSAWWHFHAHISQHRPGHSDQATPWWLTEGWACHSSRVNPMTWATESFLPIDMTDIVLKYGHFLRVWHESGEESWVKTVCSTETQRCPVVLQSQLTTPATSTSLSWFFHGLQLKVLSTHLRRVCSRNVDTYKQKSQKPWPALLGNFCEIRGEVWGATWKSS